ncbi:MAG: hemolysin family protein [Armatimonadota bacterium]
MTLTLSGQIILIVVLLVASAFFTGSEVAFLVISRSRVEHWKESGGWLAGVVSYLHHHRAVLLSTIILGITTCNYMAEHVATAMSIDLIGVTLGPPIAAVVMTAIILTFCEATPMHYAAGNPDGTVRKAGGAIYLLSWILRPIVVIMAYGSHGVLRLLGVHAASILPSVSEDQLKAMIETSKEQGVLEAGERRMLRGVLDFGDQTVAEVMTPRRDMVSVEETQTLDEAVRIGMEVGHSRLPVYRDTPDHIVGVLHMKDVLPYVVTDDLQKACRSAARPPHYILETMPADAALKQLQNERQMIAIVRDEYGGTAGLVTVEDLLEEIVGDIKDEYDHGEEAEVRVIGEGHFVCDARVNLRILSNYVETPLPVDEFDSLGGWLLHLAGSIPEAGETFESPGLRMMVQEVSQTHIEKVRVSEVGPETSDDSGR